MCWRGNGDRRIGILGGCGGFWLGGRRGDVEYERDLVDNRLGDFLDVCVDFARALEGVTADTEENNVVKELSKK